MIRFLLFFVLGFLQARAATYFIDSVAGDDFGAGTSTGAAWQHCPGDTAATGVAGSTGQAGNNFCFKGGVIYPNPISITGNNSSFCGATNTGVNVWGTGKAILDLNNVTIPGFYIKANAQGVTIKWFEIRNCGGYADDDPILDIDCNIQTITARSGFGIRADLGNNKNIFISDCFIHRCGQWREFGPWAEGNQVTGNGVAVADVENLTIQNCEFTKCAHGVQINSFTLVKNVRIHNCIFHDWIVWCCLVGISAPNAAFSDILVNQCIFRNHAQHDFGNWQACGEKPHCNGVFFQSNYDPGYYPNYWTNITINACSFLCDYKMSSAGGTGSIWASQGPSFNVYNCVFSSDSKTISTGAYYEGGGKGGGTLQVVRICNNTFVDAPTSFRTFMEQNITNRNVIMKNNLYLTQNGVDHALFVDLKDSVNDASSLLPTAMNNNLLWDTVKTEANRHPYYTGIYSTLTQFKTTYNREQNSKWADPKLLTTAAIPSNRNLHLQSGSAAIGMGENLTSLGITTDRDCYPRPATGPWDVGAYIWRPIFQLATNGIVLDNTSGAGVVLTGAWTASTGALGYYGPNYVNDGNTGKGTKSVKYTPTIPTTGNYRVDMSWAEFATRATAVPVAIVSAGGTTNLTVNQTFNGAKWNSLGVYPFNAGTGGSVTISNTGTTGFVVADAVRWVSVP